MRRRAVLAGAAGFVLLARPAQAGSLSVAPTRLQLDPRAPSGALKLRNADSGPALLQVDTYEWLDSTAVEAMQPTRELVALPAVVELPPGEERLIRVALRAPAELTRERCFRVILAEVPQARGAPGGVRFALGFSVPVFLTPPGAAPQPRWSLEGDRLVLANTGTAHVQVRRLELVDRAGRTLVVLEEPAYVLAGKRHAWTLPSGRAAAAVEVLAESPTGPLRASLAGPPG
jgi:fimbrial chaperone protein